MNRVLVSPFFYLDEFTRSEMAARHGIKIEVPLDSPIFSHLEDLAARVLTPLRININEVIHVLSGYRPLEVNRLLGSKDTSQHTRGLAADIVAPAFGTPHELAQRIIDLKLPFDQLIMEFDEWVHVSYSCIPRGEVLTARHVNGATIYERGLV